MRPCSDRHGSPDQRGSSHAGDKREHGRSASVDRLVRRRQDESGHGRRPGARRRAHVGRAGAEKRRACDRGGLSSAGRMPLPTFCPSSTCSATEILDEGRRDVLARFIHMKRDKTQQGHCYKQEAATSCSNCPFAMVKCRPVGNESQTPAATYSPRAVA